MPIRATVWGENVHEQKNKAVADNYPIGMHGQIAKLLGAHVTAVTSTRNLELVARLGADDVIDYTTTEVTRGVPRFDLIFELAGARRVGDA